ncbi:MAG: DnaJ-class molecular chaperone [Chthonomonadaceae bacterium]|nr:DnaJ-class molecular chaperone [Chthonomonadaceae bacterium]
MGPLIDIEMPILLSWDEAVQGCERRTIFFRRDQECAACSGKGFVSGRPCAPCEGTGATFCPHRLVLTLPPGIDDRCRVRVRGQGNAAHGRRSWGDLTFVCYLRSDYPPQGEGFDVAGSDGNKALGNAKTAAKQAMRLGDTEQAVARLSDLHVEMLQDAETHAILGIAYANMGDKDRAAIHLYMAVEQEPSSSVNHFNAGFFEAALGNPIQACVCYEAALDRASSYPRAREALQKALVSLWDGLNLAGGTEADTGVLNAIRQAMSARQYVRATALFAPMNLAGRPVALQNTLRFLWGCAHLLACCSEQGDSVAEAAALLDACADAAPDNIAFQRGVLALRHYVRYDCDLDGLLALAKYQITARRYAEAGTTLVRAVQLAQVYAPPQANVAVVDPLIQAKQASVLKRLEAVRAALKASPGGQSDRVWLTGLADLAEAYFQVAVSARIEPGWPFSVCAVQSLEAAFAQVPNDAIRRLLFFQAVDYCNHLAEAMLKQFDFQLQELLQNTMEALRSAAIPEVPLRKLMRTPETRSELKDLLKAAGRSLLSTAQEPLRGEFIVAARDGLYVLTNYWLLLRTDPSAAPHLIPLSIVQKYSPRAASIQTSTLLIGYRDGRQLALNRIPNKSFPPVDLLEYLLAARMWEALPDADRMRLETGSLPSAESGGVSRQGAALAQDTAGSPKGMAVPMTPARPANAVCGHCGRLSGSQDVFCRQCGAALEDNVSSRAKSTGE